MAYIYYIMRNKDNLKGVYVGQDIHDVLDYDNSRIAKHAKIAYGLHTGKHYGAEELMKQNSLSNLWYKIYDNEADCFGVGLQAFNEFKKYWIHSKPNTLQEKLDFAEMCHILINHLNPTISTYNIGIGGQNTWTFKQDCLEKYAEEVDKLKRKKSSFSYVNILKKYPELSKLQIHFPDGIKDGVKVFEPEGYQIVRLIAKAITEGCLLDSQEWQQFLTTNIINIINTLDVNNETANVVLFQKGIIKYLEEKVRLEILDWTRVTKLHFEFKIKMDFTQDALRIAKMLAKRIKYIANYSGQLLQYMLYGGDNRKRIKMANSSLSEQDSKILRITRAAYIEDIHWTPPVSIDKSPFNQWYVSALGYLTSGAVYRDIRDSSVAYILKKVSYESFKVWVSKAISKGSFSMGQTLYEQKAFGPTGESFYRGGVNQDHIEVGEYNLQTAVQTLRWKVRDEVESKQIHGGLLHYWDVYYRQMVTIWLRDVHNSVLEKKENENSKTFYQSQRTGAKYYFTDSTWEEIEEYQKHSLKDLIIY